MKTTQFQPLNSDLNINYTEVYKTILPWIHLKSMALEPPITGRNRIWSAYKTLVENITHQDKDQGILDSFNTLVLDLTPEAEGPEDSMDIFYMTYNFLLSQATDTIIKPISLVAPKNITPAYRDLIYANLLISLSQQGSEELFGSTIDEDTDEELYNIAEALARYRSSLNNPIYSIRFYSVLGTDLIYRFSITVTHDQAKALSDLPYLKLKHLSSFKGCSDFSDTGCTFNFEKKIILEAL